MVQKVLKERYRKGTCSTKIKKKVAGGWAQEVIPEKKLF